MMKLLMDFGNYAQIYEYYLYHCCIFELFEFDLAAFVGGIFLALVDNHIDYWNDGNIDLNYLVDELILDSLGFLEHLRLYFSQIF